MHYLHQIFNEEPLLALFFTIALGYFVGKFRVKRFVLGGIAGSLLMGVLIGQLGIKIPEAVGTIFFAMFIYAVGYQGGPQFFRSLNRETAVQLISAAITCILGLLCVLVAAWLFHLDRGTAAGLAAGGLTQSAIIGSAGDAIAKLGVSEQIKHTLQSNVAVGYAVCYIFGSFGPILMLATIFPGMMKWDLREEAKKLASKQAGGQAELEPGQFVAIRDLETRVFQIDSQSLARGKKLEAIFERDMPFAVEAIVREDELIELKPDLVLADKDIVAVTAKAKAFIQHSHYFGAEVAKPNVMQLTEEVNQVVLTNKKYIGKTLEQAFTSISEENRYGVFVNSVSRLGEKLAATANIRLHRGDELELTGRPSYLNRLSKLLGSVLRKDNVTDFVFFGLGMVIGYLIGLITFKIFDVTITLGAGVGCLFSGLIFGWLRSTHPRYGTLPSGASNFLRDFGLAVFVSVIGITAGPEAIETIKQYGLELFFLGVGVTLIPQIITFYISYYLLKIKNPITLLATIAGGRSANPGFAALLDKAGNSTPVLPFTATYAIANILLTLWGPIIIALIMKN